MPMPRDIGIVDLMLDIPSADQSEWYEFLNTPNALYVLNDSPQGWKSVKACADVGMP